MWGTERPLAASDLPEQMVDLGLDGGFVVATVFDQVDGARRIGPGVDQEVAHLVVDDVLSREPEHGLINRLDRARVRGHEPLGAGESCVEARIAEDEQRAMALEVRQPQARFGDDAERTLAAGHQLREVDGRPVGRGHVHQVVSRHVAAQLREGARDIVAT